MFRCAGTTAATCVGLVHGSCWLGAEEPGTKHDLKGKGAAGGMAREVALAKGIAKSTLLGVTAPPVRTRSVVEESMLAPSPRQTAQHMLNPRQTGDLQSVWVS